MPNLNVLTGETGAGKSIIIDSLNFALGGKVTKSLIKQDCSFMKVVATFCPPFSKNVVEVLSQFDIDIDDKLIISRKYSLDGKNDIKANGLPLSVTMLKHISSLLVDIHGQHEHQRLLNENNHLSIVDSFIKDKSTFEEYSKKYLELISLNASIDKLHGSQSNQERMLDLLSYQINEIENADIKSGEDESLEQKKILMQNAEKIYNNLSSAVTSVSNLAIDGIKTAVSNLNSITKYDETLSSLVDRLESNKYDLIDLSQELKLKADSISFDMYDFEQIDARLDLIKTLKKKYGPSLQDVFAFLSNAKREYDEILNSKETLNKLLIDKDHLLDELYSLANKMHEMRVKYATNLEIQTKKELDFLGMKNSKFVVSFSPIIDRQNIEQALNKDGYDNVKFMFSANLGQNLKPLSEIISGGEASRFMLALKNILAENDDISLMVFDEIDSGISGEMGFKVACKLSNIARTHQVMSVSHLPQICAMADNNIVVEKIASNGETKVIVNSLDENGVYDEIVRLSGGSSGNEASLSHAKALKQKCNDYKKSI